MNSHPESESAIPTNFDTQMNNHSAVQRFASSNWKESRDKYRDEAWLKKSISERKLNRARPHSSMGSSVLLIAILPVLAVGYGMYSYSNKNSTSLMQGKSKNNSRS
jgi:hypothetical protein